MIPVYNEEASLAALAQGLTEVMDQLGALYELVFVDDGSTDGSLEVLRHLAAVHPSVTVRVLEGHRGKEPALQAGFEASTGGILITLDADLQNDPMDIPRLLDRLEEGYDVVCGWRRKRQDSRLKKISSRLANGFRRIVLQDPVHDVGCALRAFRRSVLECVPWSGERLRFFTWVTARQGFRIGELSVQHHARRFGVSKFGIWDRFAQGCRDLWRIRVLGV